MLLAISLLIVPACAYTYHGYTSSWDRGGGYQTDYATSYNEPSTGTLIAYAYGGYAEAYLNSASVEAIANVNSIVVTVWYGINSLYLITGSLTFEVRLYSNGIYQGTQSIPGLPVDNYAQFTFTGLNIQSGDDLDVDVKFIASGNCEMAADLTFVGFVTN